MPAPQASLVLLAHAASTLVMVGVIWFVQIVHYPLFAEVGAGESVRYAVANQRRTAFLVIPVMVIEGIAAIWLVWDRPGAMPVWQPLSGLVLLLVIWTSTAVLQVPQHGRLARAHEPLAIRRLVGTNWVRTVAWTLRGALALAMLGEP